MINVLFKRREFFSRAALMSAAALAHISQARSASEVSDGQRTIGLGFSLYGAKSLSLSDALQAVAEVGYYCVELPVMPDWPGDSGQFSPAARKQFASELQHRHLRLSALMENLPALGGADQHAAHLERLKRAAELAHALAPAAGLPDGKPPIIETIVGGRAGEFEQVSNRLVDRLSEYAKVAKDAQVVVAVKAHIGNAIQNPKQLLGILHTVGSPWLRPAFDYSHFELQDIDMKLACDALLPHAVFIHVKDTERAQGKRGFLLPGEGATDYVALLKLIGQSTYRGDVVVEVSSQVSNRPGYDPQAAMRKCYNHLAAAFTQAGLNRE
jgi:inosose dehydratase